MARKAKKPTHKMPPLSFTDKVIYWLLLLLLCVAYFVLLFGPLHLRHIIAFSDESVMAVEDNISTWWLGVPWMSFFLMTFILWVQPYQDRKPILGRRNFKYGPPAWPKVYPLFMKNKPYVFISERKRKERKQIAIILLVVLLISFIPLPWSLYGRDCLKSNGSVAQYNMFNKQIYDFSPGEFEKIEIETYRYSTGKYYKTRHWGVRMTFITASGSKYTFDHKEFRDNTQSETLYWLVAMTNIKQRYNPSIIHYEGIEDLRYVVTDKNLTEEEAKLLYQLFGQT